MLTEHYKKYIDNCVLAWLATSSLDKFPNVSPKEIFTHWEDNVILVANIASPNSVRNIKENAQVCISILDILVQKGFQFKGIAEIIHTGDESWGKLIKPLITLAGEKFPFKSLTKFTVTKAKPILAPSYIFFPDTKEETQIAAAKNSYGLDH